MNVLITYLSIMNPNLTEDTIYSYETDLMQDGTCLKLPGTQTNEAPTKYIFKLLSQRGEKLDKIICICTTEVLKIKHDKLQVTPFVFYETKIQEFCEKECFEYFPEFRCIKYENEMTRVLDDVIKKIDIDSNVFLDITGGQRDATNILQLLTRFLKYNNINTELSIYANLVNQDISDVVVNGRIEKNESIVKMYDLLDAFTEFKTNAKCDLLVECLKEFDDPLIKEFVNSIREFSDALRLCHVKELPEKISCLKNCLNDIQNVDIKNNNIIILKRLNDFFFNKINILNSNENDFLNIIEWCLDNGLIQQALVFYCEKIPDYLFDNGYIKSSICGTTNNELLYDNLLFYKKYCKKPLANRLKVVGDIKDIDFSNDFTISITIEDLQKISYAYIYAIIQRNSICHANDDDCFNTSQNIKEKYEELRYSTDRTSKAIIKHISDSLIHLRSLSAH